MNWLRVSVVVISGAAASCTATPPPGAVPSSFAAEKWTVGCQDDQRDPYGKVIEREKCWALVSYFENSVEGLPIGVATLFEVDHSGPRMASNEALDTDICDEVPRRIPVDGRRIDALPMADRIEVALGGQRLTREKDRPWPYCNVHNETTTLLGAKAAFADMMQRWSARQAL